MGEIEGISNQIRDMLLVISVSQVVINRYRIPSHSVAGYSMSGIIIVS